MHVHIAPVGCEKEYIYKVFKEVGKVDVIYFLHSRDLRTIAEELSDSFSIHGYRVELKEIKLDDFMSIVNLIYDIAKEYEPKTKFSINITGGTKLISAAAYYSAYYIRAETWYSQYIVDKDKKPIDELCKVIQIKSPTAVDISHYKDSTRKILKYIYDCENGNPGSTLTNEDIARETEKSKQNVTYHLKILKNDDLINIEKVGRENRIKLTEHGVMIARYAHSDNQL